MGKKPGPPKEKRTIHGVKRFLRTGTIGQQHRGLYPFIRQYQEGLMRDIAGPDGQTTTAQAVLIHQSATALTILKLIERHIVRTKLLERDNGAVSFVLHDLGDKWLSWDRALGRHLQALGIERRSVPDPPLMLPAEVVDIEPAGDGEAVTDGSVDRPELSVITQPEGQTPADRYGGAGEADSPRTLALNATDGEGGV